MPNSNIRKKDPICLFVKGMIQLIAMFVFMSGCDFFNKPLEPDEPVPAPLAESSSVPEIVSAGPVTTNVPEVVLVMGQMEEEVRQLLGAPSGVISSSNRTVFLYSGEPLEFTNGRLTTPTPDILQRIAERRARAVAPNTDAATPAGIKKALGWIPSIKKTVEEKSVREIVLTDDRKRKIDHSRLTVPGKITVVDFYATWCGPCRQMAPVLDKIVKGQSDVVLRKVDIGNWGSATAEQYDVRSVPNVRVFDQKGRLVAPPTSSANAVMTQIELARKQ